MNILEILDKGGPVVWILFCYSVIALTIVLERYIHFIRMGRLPQDFIFQLQEALSKNNLTSLISELRGPEVAVISGIHKASQQGVKDLIRTATRIGSQELQRMERGFRTLGLLGDTAPLLGLFGTITGMIKAFMVIEQAGGKVDAQALATGIWEAMVTTGVGLAVALPILFLLHWLESLATQRTNAMHHYASLVIETLPHQCESTSVDSVHHREVTSSGV
ncbi:MAG: MotA/TolQ/ExbB proton channel family protein [Gammaproteobacteria bacterium]|nr:MotA/TolQ/ExbB proton channel family protein [Gammaproteobacteria bacterium]MCW8987533.1 MotA/TolQ/ExbB proton channel family protein [Gammaproteobacteria bacterium]MCW9029987.1 MotA/TolQ/ExbB proton channel family protein [Gammaproteobacteria bacterium]